MTENGKPERASWLRHLSASATASAAGVVLSQLWMPAAVEFLLMLFILGYAAGWVARRTGWLVGAIVGLPVSVVHLTTIANRDYHSLGYLLGRADYWGILIPTAVVAACMAVLGGVSGAWMHDMRLKRDREV